MQKFVLEYDFSPDGHTTQCVQYESAEALYCDLEAEINKYLKLREECDKLTAAWIERKAEFMKKYKNDRKKTINEIVGCSSTPLYTDWHEAYQKLTGDKFPTPPNTNIVLNYQQFHLADFIEKRQIAIPEIQTLDEWFEDNLFFEKDPKKYE